MNRIVDFCEKSVKGTVQVLPIPHAAAIQAGRLGQSTIPNEFVELRRTYPDILRRIDPPETTGPDNEQRAKV